MIEAKKAHKGHLMFIGPLMTDHPGIHLVSPDVERDAPLAVAALAGPEGRYTLKMMGQTDAENQAPTLAEERRRIQGFLDGRDQYNWMIDYEGQLVGTAWVDLQPTTEIAAPALAVMIAAPMARGRGIGLATMRAVMTFLQGEGHACLHARHLVENRASAAMLTKLGFMNDGSVYIDKDGLQWQNVVYKT
jgi:RimJ/RimL family protein N-acetyltransferase